MTRPKIPAFARTLPLVALSLCLAPSAIHAQETWDGGGTTNNWSDGPNWTDNTAPSGATGAALTFSGTTRTTNVNDIAGLGFTSLTFNSSNWSLSGNPLTLSLGINSPIGTGRSVTVANDLTLTVGATLQTQNIASSTLTLSGNFTATGLTITKDGSGTSGNAALSTLVFNGTGKTVTIGTLAQRKGAVLIDNGVSAAIGSVLIGNDATHNSINPVFTVSGSATSLTTTTDIQIGRQANDARLVVTGGNVTTPLLLTGQHLSALATSGLHQSGGTVNVTNLRLANNGASTISVAGGTLNIAQGNPNSSTFGLTEKGASTFTVSGSGAVNVGPTGNHLWNLAANTGSATLNLDGGVLTVGGFTKVNTTGNTTLRLNGGTLRAGQSYADFLPALTNTTVQVGPGGAVIDTNGFNIGVAATLLANGSAGLTKQGSGTLTLSGANTFTGSTTVASGGLAVSGGSALSDTASLVLQSGQLQLYASETVDLLFFGSAQQAAGTWGATGSAANNIDDTRFSGPGVLTVLTGPAAAAAPTDIQLSSAAFTESTDANQVVGTLASTDANLSDTHVYALVAGTGSTHNALFAINGAQLRTASLIDVASDTLYSIRVRSTDSAGLTFEKTFSITVYAMVAPTDIALSSLSILGNHSAGELVANLSAVDANIGETHTFALVAGTGDTQNASFTLVGAQLRTVGVLPLGTYAIRIRATDSAGLNFEEAVTISVTAGQAYVWTASGASASWGTAANWTPSGFPGVYQSATFDNSNSAATITLDGDRQLLDATFTAAKAAWTLAPGGATAGAVLNVTNGDADTADTGTITVNGTTLNLDVPVNTFTGSAQRDNVLFTGAGGTVNLTRTISRTATFSSGASAMIYRVLGQNFAASTINVVAGPTAPATLAIESDQSHGFRLATAGGAPESVSTIVLRNGATHTQSANQIQLGQNGHGLLQVGDASTSGNLVYTSAAATFQLGQGITGGGVATLDVVRGTITFQSDHDTDDVVQLGVSNYDAPPADGIPDASMQGVLVLRTDGVVITERPFTAGTGTALVQFDGGLLTLNRDSGLIGTELFAPAIALESLVGGARLNTNGYSTAIPASMSGSGGLTKLGAGRLALTGVNTYSGHTVVSAGTLALNGHSLVNTGRLVLDGGVTELSGSETVGTLFYGAAQQAAGTYGASGSGAANIDDTRFTGSGVLVVSQGPLTGFASWASANGITGQPAAGDFDHDGFSNLAEYALGNNPAAPDAIAAPVSASRVVSFTKGAQAVANGDVTYAIEESDDLGLTDPWTVVTPTVNDASTISYTLPVKPRVFARLKVTLVP